MSRLRSCDDHPKWVAGCTPCNDRSRLYEKRRAVRLGRGERLSAPAGHVATRLQQLRAAGYRLQDLAEHCGIHYKQLWELSTRHPGYVQLKTFHAVERMYTELRPFPGPSNHAAAWAARHGWTPPPPLDVPDEVSEDIVDEVVVARAVKGERVPLTRAEILVAWRQLETTGLSTGKISERLHVSERTINRWRSGKIPASRRTA